MTKCVLGTNKLLQLYVDLIIERRASRDGTFWVCTSLVFGTPTWTASAPDGWASPKHQQLTGRGLSRTFNNILCLYLCHTACYTDKHQSTPKHTHTHPLSTWTNTVTSERCYRWARGSEILFGWQVEVAGVHSLLKVERRLVLLDRFLHAAYEQEAPWTLSDFMWQCVLGSLCRLSYLLLCYGCEYKCVLRILQR